MANGTTRQYEWVQGEPKKLDPPFTSEHTPKLEGKYLDKCRKLMAGYDRETAEDWREGINTQLLVVRPQEFPSSSQANPYLVYPSLGSNDSVHH